MDKPKAKYKKRSVKKQNKKTYYKHMFIYNKKKPQIFPKMSK